MTFSLTFESLESRVEGKRSLYSQFSLSPLNVGQGVTLGNSLRRTLLSDIPGIAITSVQILGINHEFATIPGIRESVLDILLNLKQIVFISDHSFDQPQLVRLHFDGPGSVTSRFIQLPSFLRVVDPDQHIATLVSENISFDLVLILESDTGYRLADSSKTSDVSSDFLALDAVFMPVTRVNYTVEKYSLRDLRKERLLLEIWTNASIHPRQALNVASNALINLLRSFTDLPVDPKTSTLDSPPVLKLSQILIEELELSVRAYNCLKRAHIHTVADLLAYSSDDLLEIKNFGQKSADEVVDALKLRFGIALDTQKASY